MAKPAVNVRIWFFRPQCLDASGSVICLVVLTPKSGHRSPACGHLSPGGEKRLKGWNWCACKTFARGHLVTLGRQALGKSPNFEEKKLQKMKWCTGEKGHHLYVSAALATSHRSHDQRLAPVFQFKGVVRVATQASKVRRTLASSTPLDQYTEGGWKQQGRFLRRKVLDPKDKKWDLGWKPQWIVAPTGVP